MADINVLSDADIALLKEHVNRLRNQRLNPPVRQPPIEVYSGNRDVLIASTPDGGIPAISGYLPGGGVECDVYQFVEGAGNEIEYLGVTKVVYNLSTNAIPGNIWILIVKDKFGVWFTTGVPQPVDCDDITFTESEAYCDDLLGTSNAVWFRSRTITLSTVEGCLVKTAGAWEILDCPPLGTATATSTVGTGTGVLGTGTAGCCGGHAVLGDILSVTLSNFINCSCLSSPALGIVNVSWLGSYWSGSAVFDGMKDFIIRLSCYGGVWSISWFVDEMGITTFTGNSVATSESCTPLALTFTLDVTGVCGTGTSAASFDVAITP